MNERVDQGGGKRERKGEEGREMEDGDRFLIFTGSRFGAASGGKRGEERINK